MPKTPKYHTNSRNPNIRPKWIAGDRSAIRLPKGYHAIAWDICQAIDQGIISEDEIREWVADKENTCHLLAEARSAIEDIETYSVRR